MTFSNIKNRPFLGIALALMVLMVSLVGVGITTAQTDTPDDTPAAPFVGVIFRETDGGVVITRVLRGSPADAAGIQRGDVVTALDGEAVTVETFAALVQAKAPGDTITLTITRDGASQDLTVTLGEAPTMGFGMRGNRGGRGGNMPGMPDFDFEFEFDGNGIRIPRIFGFGDLDDMRMGRVSGVMLGLPLGVEAVLLDESIAQEYNTPATEGLYVVRVPSASPAAAAGLQGRDVITAINGTALNQDTDFQALLESIEPGTTLTLDIARESGETLQIEVQVDDLMLPIMPMFQFRLPFGEDGYRWRDGDGNGNGKGSGGSSNNNGSTQST